MSNNGTLPAGVRVVAREPEHRYAFSICTLMTDRDQYAEMVQSYRDAGFGDDCEFLCVDNSAGNSMDAYQGYNAFLAQATGEYVILTHQDVQLNYDRRGDLERRLAELNNLDPDWGACGNSGILDVGGVAMRISDPHGENSAIGELPTPITALDENFMVTRRSTNLCLSHDLSGFHMYGPDLCVMAAVKGHKSYVIDFHLRHLSAGKVDDSFRASEKAFTAKYARAFRPRWLQTTATVVYLSGSRLQPAVATLGRWLGVGR